MTVPIREKKSPFGRSPVSAEVLNLWVATTKAFAKWVASGVTAKAISYFGNNVLGNQCSPTWAGLRNALHKVGSDSKKGWEPLP